MTIRDFDTTKGGTSRFASFSCSIPVCSDLNVSSYRTSRFSYSRWSTSSDLMSSAECRIDVEVVVVVDVEIGGSAEKCMVTTVVVT